MRKLVLILFAAAAAAPADAAVVYMKDGGSLQGTVVSATASDVRLDTGAGIIDIGTSRIARIDYADAEPTPPAPQAEPQPQPQAAPRRFYRARREYREQWDAGPHDDLLSFELGLAAPVTGLSSPDGGSGSNGDVGPQIGVEYLHRVAPLLSLGADFEYLYRSPTFSHDLVPGYVSNVSGSTEMLLGVAKIDLTDRGPARPYVLAGLGVDNTSTFIQAAPQGFGPGWPDTGSYETRTLVDSNSWGLASTLRLGVDFNVSDPYVFSVEGGWTGLYNGRISPNSQGQSLGLSGLNGPLGFFTVGARWGLRF